jgi:hypothetical protein
MFRNVVPSSSYKIWAGKPKGERPLGRPGYIWEDNTKMGLREISGHGLDSSDLEQRPLADCCEHGNETLLPKKYWEFLEWLSFSKRTHLHGISNFLVHRKRSASP